MVVMQKLSRPSGTGTIVQLVADPEALRALVPEWEELAAEAGEPNPFYEHWMLLPALAAFPDADFRCVVIWDNGKLAALIPMRWERRWRSMPVAALRSWVHRNMVLCTPLVRAASAARCVSALLESDLAPVLEFDLVPAEGVFYGALAEAALAGACPWLVTDAYMRAILVRQRDPRSRFNSNLKNNLRRWESRLRACGALEPVRLGEADDVAAWRDEFLQLEASGWKGEAGSALASREQDRRFAVEVLDEAHRRGRLVITGLNLGGRPLARHVAITAGEGAICFKIAYDEAHAKHAPGIVAEVENVRQFMETPGPRWVDSNTSRENTSYGRVWKDRRTVQSVAVGARGVGRAAVAALPLLRLAKDVLRRLAARAPGSGRDSGRLVPTAHPTVGLNPK
jgi:CelD/BcsL family acetyltransferase involved in cellulose biosynthesis